jgi:hypothetical protein
MRNAATLTDKLSYAISVAIGGNRTWLFAPHMSAYDPKRTSILKFALPARCRNGPLAFPTSVRRRPGSGEAVAAFKTAADVI